MNLTHTLDGLPNGAALSFDFPESALERKDLDRVGAVLTARGMSMDVDGGRYATCVYVWRGTAPMQTIHNTNNQYPYVDLLRSANQLERS